MTFSEEKERIKSVGVGIDERIRAVIFNEEEHSYWYNGKALHGVTGAIGKMLGKSFPDTDTVKIATLYGHDVHSEVEHYFNDGRKDLSSEGAKWVVDTMEHWGDKLFCDRVEEIKSEVMVSDFEGTASKIDLVLRTLSGNDVLFDIKTTSTFNREYCSLQLSVYKKLYEQNYNRNVTGLFVLGTKSRRAFRIIEQPSSKVDKILGMNKA
jgi:hypothetical protein